MTNVTKKFDNYNDKISENYANYIDLLYGKRMQLSTKS